ncbi:MAG: molecular chaperone DnaK [Chloroflexota bacterium]|nr:molecular chaperone DnaK [Chloroflexota bacterium]
MAKILGIDLGTTNSCMAVITAGEPEVVENSEGGRTTPSVVALNEKSGERYVGQAAKRQAVTNPDNTVYSAKRFIGRKFSEVEAETREVSFEVAAGNGGDAAITMGGRAYSPPEISAMVLQKLKADAEAKLGEPVTQAVITVPAYFNDSQRQATKDAGAIAGLEVLRIINEPTAASLAYGLDKKSDETIAVFDLGGGTFDISVLSIGEGVFEVKSTNGDTHLGGDDWDQRVVEWLANEFKRDQGVDLRADRMALQRLREAAEKAKIELSSTAQTEINLPFITADASGPKHLAMNLTRSKLEQVTADLLDRTTQPVRQALADAGVSADQVDEVVLVGGMTRSPAVGEKVKQMFGKEPHKGVNPDEVVAVGAAIQAGVLQGDVQDVVLVDVTPLTLGIETLGSVLTPLIKRNTSIPTKATETFTTAADNQTSVEVHVLQGERPMAGENKTIGRFSLDGIAPAMRGMPQIEVSFDIDANGILNVSASDKATGKEQRITITASSGLSKDEVERLIQEAESHAEEDQRRRDLAETRNAADSAVYQAERALSEHGESVGDDLKQQVRDRISDVQTALSANDPARIRAAVEELTKAAALIGQAVYQQQQGAEGKPPPEGGPSGDSDGDDTVEGNYREV